MSTRAKLFLLIISQHTQAHCSTYLITEGLGGWLYLTELIMEGLPLMSEERHRKFDGEA